MQYSHPPRADSPAYPMHTALYYDPLYLQHDTGNHPENSDRLRAIMGALDTDSGIGDSNLDRRIPHAVPPELLRLVHDADYVNRVEEAADGGRPFLDTPDCVVSEGTHRVALHAAGAVTEAVGAVDAGQIDNAFVACRPPGPRADSFASARTPAVR